MNKYQEALDIVDTVLHLMCEEKREDGYEPTMDELLEAMSTLKELMDKAIPEIIAAVKIFVDGNVGITYPACPSCKKYIDEFEDLPYCPYCGQALDWNEEDEH